MTIFDSIVEPRARVSDPATAHEAARNTEGLSAQRRSVLWAMREVEKHTHPDGATAYDVMLRLGYGAGVAPAQNVIARRLDDLMALGLAEPTELTRPGSSSRHLRVWHTTTEGVEALTS